VPTYSPLSSRYPFSSTHSIYQTSHGTALGAEFITLYRKVVLVREQAVIFFALLRIRCIWPLNSARPSTGATHTFILSSARRLRVAAIPQDTRKIPDSHTVTSFEHIKRWKLTDKQRKAILHQNENTAHFCSRGLQRRILAPNQPRFPCLTSASRSCPPRPQIPNQNMGHTKR
jgi:hypothetical protein